LASIADTSNKTIPPITAKRFGIFYFFMLKRKDNALASAVPCPSPGIIWLWPSREI